MTDHETDTTTERTSGDAFTGDEARAKLGEAERDAAAKLSEQRAEQEAAGKPEPTDEEGGDPDPDTDGPDAPPPPPPAAS